MNPPPPRGPPGGRSPSRPSFLAPTKASLARSHPEILKRALSRSPTRRSAGDGSSSQNVQQSQAETRIFGLRDRKALRPSLTSIGSPADPLKADIRSPLSRRSSGLGAFAAPPRRVSRRIRASDFQFQSPQASRVNKVDPSVVNTPDDQLASELGSVADPNRDFDQSSLHDELEEPDLPPTPTQLGLEPPPGRHRGALNSSPSIQYGTWGKRRAMGDLEQSPSKLRTVYSGIDTEDLLKPGLRVDDTMLSEPVLKKRRLKRELSSELESLKKDVAMLEGFSKKLDQSDEYSLNDLISILKSDDPTLTATTKARSDAPTISSLISTLLPFSTKRPPKPRDDPDPINPFVLGQNAQTEPYLSAFAPLNLTSSSNIIPSTKTDALIERHTLALSAPPPFSSKYYNISIIYETNPETQSLISLSVHDPSNFDSHIPHYLRQWLNQRLENPLLKLDVSGLCWGINRYWEALVLRAQIWTQIETQHEELNAGYTNATGSRRSAKTTDGPSSGSSKTDNDKEILTPSDLRRILPHLERTSMLFESGEKSLKAIISCEVTLDDWTSEPELTPSICVSSAAGSDNNSGTKTEQESKKLFHAILAENANPQTGGIDARAIVKAAECVLRALFGENRGKS